MWFWSQSSFQQSGCRLQQWIFHFCHSSRNPFSPIAHLLHPKFWNPCCRKNPFDHTDHCELRWNAFDKWNSTKILFVGENQFVCFIKHELTLRKQLFKSFLISCLPLRAFCSWAISILGNLRHTHFTEIALLPMSAWSRYHPNLVRRSP